MNCKICSNKAVAVFSKMILGKYEVAYYQCSECCFLQTEEPYWLDETYKNGAISALDTGVIARNLKLSRVTADILQKLFKDFKDFRALDYGGGEGIFVRMMRDLGYNFYRHDLYADNLYAQYFDLKDLPADTKFDTLTAFEVFEHLADPIAEIRKMFHYTDVIIFSTELQPSKEAGELNEWWYLVPEAGQHVSFYDIGSLKQLALKFKAELYTDHKRIHVLSKKPVNINPFHLPKLKDNSNTGFFLNLLNMIFNKDKKHKEVEAKTELRSLISQDFEMIRKKVTGNGN